MTEITQCLIQKVQKQEETILEQAAEFNNKADAIHQSFREYEISSLEKVWSRMQEAVQAAFV